MFFKVIITNSNFVNLMRFFDDTLIAGSKRVFAKLGEAYADSIIQAAANVSISGAKRAVRILGDVTDTVDNATLRYILRVPPQKQAALVESLAMTRGVLRAGKLVGRVSEEALVKLLKPAFGDAFEAAKTARREFDEPWVNGNIEDVIDWIGDLSQAGCKNLDEKIAELAGTTDSGNLAGILNEITAARQMLNGGEELVEIGVDSKKVSFAKPSIPPGSFEKVDIDIKSILPDGRHVFTETFARKDLSKMKDQLRAYIAFQRKHVGEFGNALIRFNRNRRNFDWSEEEINALFDIVDKYNDETGAGIVLILRGEGSVTQSLPPLN